MTPGGKNGTFFTTRRSSCFGCVTDLRRRTAVTRIPLKKTPNPQKRMKSNKSVHNHFLFGFLFREIDFRQGGDDVERLQTDVDDG